MGWEAPIKTDMSGAVMEATLQKRKINTMWLLIIKQNTNMMSIPKKLWLLGHYV